MNIVEKSLNWWKTLWEKKQLLVMSNLSFSHSIFKNLYCRHVKTKLVWERIIPFPNKHVFYWCEVQIIWKFCGKRRIARNKQSILFPQRFSTLLENSTNFHQIQKLQYANSLKFGRAQKFKVWERVNFETQAARPPPHYSPDIEKKPTLPISGVLQSVPLQPTKHRHLLSTSHCPWLQSELNLQLPPETSKGDGSKWRKKIGFCRAKKLIPQQWAIKSNHGLTLLPNQLRPLTALTKKGICKQCGKMKTILVSSMFSFSHNVFYPFIEKFRHFRLFSIAVSKSFNFDRSWLLSHKELKFIRVIRPSLNHFILILQTLTEISK